jgi:hypothetical protein
MIELVGGKPMKSNPLVCVTQGNALENYLWRTLANNGKLLPEFSGGG